MPTHAYVILTLTILSTLGGVGLYVWSVWRAKPKLWFDRVSVSYLPGAHEMSDIPALLRAAREVLTERYPQHVSSMLDFHLEVRPHDDAMMLHRRWNGFCVRFRPHIFAKQRIKATIRQLVTSTGAVRPVSATALTHELAEHIVPFTLSKDWNIEHDPKWVELTSEIRARQRLNASKAALSQ